MPQVELCERHEVHKNKYDVMSIWDVCGTTGTTTGDQREIIGVQLLGNS